MGDTVQTRIDKSTLDTISRMVPLVQDAFPTVRINRADVLRMVLTRGIDELNTDIEKGRVR